MGGDRLPYPLDPSWLLTVQMAAVRVGVACALEDPMAETARRWRVIKVAREPALLSARRIERQVQSSPNIIHWAAVKRPGGIDMQGFQEQ